jgi:hypothetical protein
MTGSGHLPGRAARDQASRETTEKWRAGGPPAIKAPAGALKSAGLSRLPGSVRASAEAFPVTTHNSARERNFRCPREGIYPGRALGGPFRPLGRATRREFGGRGYLGYPGGPEIRSLGLLAGSTHVRRPQPRSRGPLHALPYRVRPCRIRPRRALPYHAVPKLAGPCPSSTTSLAAARAKSTQPKA